MNVDDETARMNDPAPTSSAPAAPLDYATAQPFERTTMPAGIAVRRIGIAMLIAVLTLSLVEFVAAVVVAVVDYGSPRVPPAFFLYLAYLAAATAITIVCLRRTWRSTIPLEAADERTIVRSWVWLAVLRLTFLGGYTLIAFWVSRGRSAAPVSGNVTIIVRTFAFALEGVLPMLVIPLIIRRRAFTTWVRPLASLFLAFAAVRVTLDLIPLVELAVSEESVMVRDYLRAITIDRGIANPLGWLLLGVIAAGVLVVRGPTNRWAMRLVALGALGWMGFLYGPALRGPGLNVVSLLSSAYTLYNALLALVPASILGWLSWQLERQDRAALQAGAIER